jgi:hypothetical protein
VQEIEELDEHTDSVFLLGTPGDSGVCDPRQVHSEVIGVEGNQDALIGPGVRELVSVGQAAASGFLDRKYIDAQPAEALGHWTRVV